MADREEQESVFSSNVMGSGEYVSTFVCRPKEEGKRLGKQDSAAVSSCSLYAGSAVCCYTSERSGSRNSDSCLH